MKKSKLFGVLFSCLLVALMACGLTASAEEVTRVCVNRIYFQLNREDNTAIVVGGTTNSRRDGEMRIPSFINYYGTDYQVVEIADEAFSRHYELSSVIFEGHLRRIGSFAFGRCGGLLLVDMTYGVDEFGENAFAQVGACTHFYVPEGCAERYAELAGRPARDSETMRPFFFCNLG